jgi:hypothetical protein
VLIWDSFHFRGFGDAVAEGAPACSACAATVQAGIITVRSGKSLLPDGRGGTGHCPDLAI